MDERTYFERPQVIAPILGSFFAIFLPLAGLQLIPNFVAWVPQASLLEVVFLGTTHFFITLALYLRGENLDYFRSSARNVAVYLCAPLFIFGFFASSEAWHWRAAFPSAAQYVLAAVRFADFFHVGRQSVGMLQLFKRGRGLPARVRTGEQVLFVGLACAQWQTFLLGGRFRSDSAYAWVPAIALAAVFLALVFAHVRAMLRDSSRPMRALPLVYLTLQATCAASAVYDTRLYLTALVMHYVEYHAIMWPRLFRSPPSATHWVDRAFGLLRPRPWLFYVALGALVVAYELRGELQPATPSTTFFVHIFDGIFAVHYFVEAFLWKFRNPFYQQALSPLYFGPASRLAEQAPPKLRGIAALREAALMLVLLVLIGFGAQRVAAADLQHRAFDPLLAQTHARWGIELAERGELAGAREHFEEAQRRAPEDAQIKQLVEWVDQRLPR